MGTPPPPPFPGVVAKDPSIYATLESLRGWGGPSSPHASSDDSLYQTCVFTDGIGDNDGDGGDRGGATPAPPPPRPRPPLTRSVSLKCGSGAGAAGPTWGGGRFGDPGVVLRGGTARPPPPRRGRHSSFRRRLLKFIPGLNRALEEEESQL